MLTKYLYIDDEQQSDVQPLIRELEHFGDEQLHIEHIRVRPMKEITAKFLDGGFDGLIIDQKLDAANENGDTVDYWGTALAQNLRTEMIGPKREVPASPIILMSNEDVYVDFYDTDESAHNLFDFAVKKGQVAGSEEYAKKVSGIAVSLAQAYKVSRENIYPAALTGEVASFDLLQPLLNWDYSIYDFTDKRFIEIASSKAKDTHTLVALILNNFVRSAGILVTENMLATKLGIDTEASEDWNDLLHLFDDYRYSGAFSELKSRWWMSRIEDWWYDNGNGLDVLRALTAKERVDAIKQVTGLNKLTEITPKYPNGKQSEKFWVNCIVTDTPLDPSDAIVAKCVDIKPWEQPLYLDPETVFKRQHMPKYSVHQDYQKKVKPLYRRLTSDD